MRSVLEVDRQNGGSVGSVTAEFAVVIPAVLLVLVGCMTGMQLASAQLRVQDAAAFAARSSARGESESLVISRVRHLVSGTDVALSREDGLVCARVSLSPAGPLQSLFGLSITASSCALAGDP